MGPLVLLALVLLWAGLTLLLAELRWFARRPLLERLAAYTPGAVELRHGAGVLSVESFREAIGPLARMVGSWAGRLAGAGDDLDRRLRRLHATLDPTTFRVRQLGWSLAGAGLGVLLSIATRPPVAVMALFVAGGATIAFLWPEQQLAKASALRRRRVRLELPVVAEQVAMLLGSGYSLTSALDRVARRGSGAVAEDLARVLGRVRQGVAGDDALREWAEVADVDAVGRLVAVLSLHHQTTDLGRLIAAEARAVRADVHRDLIATIEKRGQQVWIPVTVATLMPGAIFIAIPFSAALGEFLGG